VLFTSAKPRCGRSIFNHGYEIAKRLSRIGRPHQGFADEKPAEPEGAKVIQ